MKLINPYVEHVDERGSFKGIADFGTWEEVNYISTKKGEVRGGHYHKLTKELFYIISGKITVVVSDLNGENEKNLKLTSGDIFLIEPYEVHTFTCDEDSLWMNFLSVKFDSKSPDLYQL